MQKGGFVEMRVVFVRTFRGVEAGMGLGSHGDELFGSEIMVKQRIQPVDEVTLFHRKRQGYPVEMSKQLFGMYTRIRTHAPYGGDGLAKQGGKCFIEQLLYGYGA